MHGAWPDATETSQRGFQGFAILRATMVGIGCVSADTELMLSTDPAVLEYVLFNCIF